MTPKKKIKIIEIKKKDRKKNRSKKNDRKK